MAARRLLILLLVLLGVSTLAAALAPVSNDRESTSTEPTTTTATTPVAAPPPQTGGLFKFTMDADSKQVNTVQLYAGEELRLAVSSKRGDQVSIPELGQVQPVTPYAAAMFDLLLDEPGDYAVRLVEENRLVGRLRVNPGARPEKDRGRASAQREQR
jgi:hypothetical protein